MPQPIAVKIGKIDVPSSEYKAVAEKAALNAAKSAASGTKFDKKYEVTLNVTVTFDKKDAPTEVSATNTFVIAENGKLVPRLAVSKSGKASAKGFGSKVDKGVDQAVDGIVGSTIETLVKTLEKLEEMEKKGK